MEAIVVQVSNVQQVDGSDRSTKRLLELARSNPLFTYIGNPVPLGVEFDDAVVAAVGDEIISMVVSVDGSWKFKNWALK